MQNAQSAVPKNVLCTIFFLQVEKKKKKALVLLEIKWGQHIPSMHLLKGFTVISSVMTDVATLTSSYITSNERIKSSLIN